MAATLQLRFDRGTVCVDAPNDHAEPLPGVLWDDRTLGWRAPAHRAHEIVRHAAAAGLRVADPLPWPAPFNEPTPWTRPSLRPYQRQAVDAWEAFGRRGIVVLPTGGGKTRVAIAAMAAARSPSAVLCPTRVLLDQWARELARWYAAPVGIVGDGEHQIEGVTVLTFESAYRRMDTLGDRFALVVIDEAHNFGGGARAEALEMCTAPMRIGLTATMPAREGAAAARMESLIGPTVCDVALSELVGGHLADFDVVRLWARLTAEEAAVYAAAYAPFAELRGAFARTHPEAEWKTLVRALASSAAGRDALRGFHRATALSALPSAKRATTTRLLTAHRDDRVLLFAATADDAYTLARDNLVPVITAETGRRERERIVSRFRDGSIRVIASARVLNEGIDLPDARVAILCGGALGVREVLQRVGRVLRAAPGKRALVYELTTADTVDDRRAEGRRRLLAPRCASFA